MRLKKRTYALPTTLLDRFEKLVAPGKRSVKVASLLEGCLERHHRESLRQEVIAGCRVMADLYLEIEKEYHPLEEEVYRVLEKPAKTRRHRSRKA